MSISVRTLLIISMMVNVSSLYTLPTEGSLSVKQEFLQENCHFFQVDTAHRALLFADEARKTELLSNEAFSAKLTEIKQVYRDTIATCNMGSVVPSHAQRIFREIMLERIEALEALYRKRQQSGAAAQ